MARNGKRAVMAGGVAVLAGMACCLPAAFGGGFQVSTQSARAGGQGDAFTAQADDPSAIYYNPAGLTQLEGTQLSGGVYAIFPQFEFSGATDAIGDASNNDPAYIPHLYLASDAGQKDWRFGLGVNTVFGLREDWGDDGPLRFVATNADLTVMNIAPTASYQLTRDFSVGAGLNIYYGDLEINNQVPFPAGPEGELRFEGDGVAVGGTVGTLWQISDQHSVGLVYRSPFRIDFDGSAKIGRPGSPEIGPSDTHASVDFPQIIVLGYAFKPTNDLTLEADLQWADWDTLDSVRAESDDPRFNSLPPRRFDYESSFTYRFGAQYQLDRNWTIRAGYVYSPTSSPEHTFTPVVMDLDSHIFTVGLGYTTRSHWSLDIAYRYVVGVDRDIDQSVNSPPGEYSDQTHAIVVTATIRL